LTSTIVSGASAPMRDGFGAARAAARLVATARLSPSPPPRRDARGGEELLVVEGDDLRAALGLEITLEIGRHVDRTDGLAGADRARRFREIAGALDDAETGRRRHLLDKRARGIRSVGVDHDHAEPADHRVAERRGQHHEGEQRHAEDQDQRGAVMQQPSQLAPGDQPEAGLRPGPHWRVRQSR
jgi:hypothetical protein